MALHELTRSYLAGQHWLVSAYERPGSGLINFVPNWIRQNESMLKGHYPCSMDWEIQDCYTIDARVPDAVDARDGI